MSQVPVLGQSAKNVAEPSKIALVALGSNVTSPFGPPHETLIWSILELSKRVGVIRSVSRFYATPCFPAGAGPDYVNAACAVAWRGTPPDLMSRLHAIEADAARQRSVRWGQRTLDVDLIALGETVWPDAAAQTRWRELPEDEQKIRAPEHLVVPHPRLQDRGFVLVPLQDIAAHWRHPLLGEDVSEMLARRPEAELREIVPLGAEA